MSLPFCFILHSCCIIVSTVGWTWCDWSLIVRTYLPSVLWHCWLGHLIRKHHPSPRLWMTYNVFGGTLNLAVYVLVSESELKCRWLDTVCAGLEQVNGIVIALPVFNWRILCAEINLTISLMLISRSGPAWSRVVWSSSRSNITEGVLQILPLLQRFSFHLNAFLLWGRKSQSNRLYRRGCTEKKRGS